MKRINPKLFIPGPVDVSERTYQAMQQGLIGHRSKDFQLLYASTQAGLQQLIGTTRPVWLSTSSAWGVMEGSVRNLVNKKVLNCCCGAFSDKWYDVSLRCGKQADKLQVEWGKSIEPDMLRAALQSGEYDVVTLVHNETSTGVQNPLRELAAVVREFEDVLLVVDTVSSLSAVAVEMDQWGIDVVLAGVQKALALPPGLAVMAVSERAIERARQVADRGYYFDFIEFDSNAQNSMTPSTPAISLIYALVDQLESIASEGFAQRLARHEDLNRLSHEWVSKRGWAFFADENRRSKSLTCVRMPEGFDTAEFVKRLRSEHNLIIDGGYGKLKGKTIRFSNMGNENRQSMQELFDAMDEVLAAM